MHPGFAVDVDALESVGAQVEATAAMLRESVRVAGAGWVPSSPSGSAAVVAAQGAEKMWLAELRRLVEELEGFGADVSASAREYRAADEVNADGLRRSGVLPR